jgi:hypothetical protein
MATTDDHDSPDRTAVTQTACWSLVIGPVDRCKGPSRENEQANTHNELQEYRPAPDGSKRACTTRPAAVAATVPATMTLPLRTVLPPHGAGRDDP